MITLILSVVLAAAPCRPPEAVRVITPPPRAEIQPWLRWDTRWLRHLCRKMENRR